MEALIPGVRGVSRAAKIKITMVRNEEELDEGVVAITNIAVRNTLLAVLRDGEIVGTIRDSLSTRVFTASPRNTQLII
jgi:hypothetical protein